MRIPARCNKRNCQARRNLSKRPEHYVRWPTCNHSGCDGKMYIDEYRLRKGPKDRAPICHEDCMHRARILWPPDKPHRVDHPACHHNADWVIESTIKASKNSPNYTRMDEDEPCPF